MRNDSRFATLARIGEMAFHSNDLANAWGITNTNTLHTTLKRYYKRGLLYRAYNGFYTLKPIASINPLYLGLKALHSYGYISTETVLGNTGIMQQGIAYNTLVGSVSKTFHVGQNQYRVRKLADRYLFNDVGIETKDGIRMATPERAIADLLYFNPRVYFDGPINWPRVKAIQKTLGYPFTPKRYTTPS